MSAAEMASESILVVRLGAMGDVIHALPAVHSLRQGHPAARLVWAIHPRWLDLLAGNPDIDEIIPVNRRHSSELSGAARRLRALRPAVALDLQGLLQSAILARWSGASQRVGFAWSEAREPFASWFYSQRVASRAAHIVDRNLELAVAAGGKPGPAEFPLPQGEPEGALPDGPFVLACPLAGWRSKQWPLPYYSALAASLKHAGLQLVVNGPPSAADELKGIEGAHAHCSSINGLIWATRRATAVVGVDSGPLHIAAALRKAGVAIYGPTNPSRNGPYGGTITVVRDAHAKTTYKRGDAIDPSMQAVRPELVFENLMAAC